MTNILPNLLEKDCCETPKILVIPRVPRVLEKE